MRTGSPVTSCGSLISSSKDFTVSRSLSQKDRAADEAEEERRADDIVSDCAETRTEHGTQSTTVTHSQQTIMQQKKFKLSSGDESRSVRARRDV